MKVLRHRLHQDDDTAVRFVRSPNVGGKVDAKYLVIHYTAGSSAQGAIDTLIDPRAKASAHLVIARDGAITQLVGFDDVAWHAGRSRWHGLEGLNAHSIGIELDNAGALTRMGDAWTAWFGRRYGSNDVLVAAHKNETSERGWHRYAQPQIQAAIDVSRVLVDQYKLLDVVGHDDIAPGRKMDPGPAFPMDQFRARVMGRRDEGPGHFQTTAALNIREGPGIECPKLPESPLKPGTLLYIVSEKGSWRYVDVLDGSGTPTLTGWVHGDYVRPV